MHWDGFTAIERDVRALVGDPRWAMLPPLARTQAIAQRELGTTDGSRWLFGGHARWYRLDRVDGPARRPASRRAVLMALAPLARARGGSN